MGKCIISKRLGENSGMGMSLFLSCFKDKDFEIVATICAWMANGWKNECETIQNYILKTMLPTPSEFIDNYEFRETHGSFFRLLTNEQLNMLLNKLKLIYKHHGSLEQCFIDTLAKKKTKYNYEIFAKMLAHNTGFQSALSNCSFYRFNLLYYWLTYKFGVWQMQRHEKALLPCNDLIFKKAHEKGITKVLLKTNLPNTKILTQKAKEIYGEINFFKMYEDLIDLKQNDRVSK